MIEHQRRVPLGKRTKTKEVWFKKAMPTEDYQLGCSVICKGDTELKIWVADVAKYKQGFKVTLTRAVPTDKWVLHYHAKHL
jgi:hypothetical protein